MNSAEANTLQMKLPSCVTCKHRDLFGPTCTAYPMGIPRPILVGEHDHRLPYEGDHGITWEAAGVDGIGTLT
jgi:hypothetical protein